MSFLNIRRFVLKYPKVSLAFVLKYPKFSTYPGSRIIIVLFMLYFFKIVFILDYNTPKL